MRMIFHRDETPVVGDGVRGGQGRSDGDVRRSGDALAYVVTALLGVIAGGCLYSLAVSWGWM